MYIFIFILLIIPPIELETSLIYSYSEVSHTL